MKDASRNHLLDILDKWEVGNLSEVEVHEIAEKLFEQKNWPDCDEGNFRSILVEVLSHLEILNHQLITQEDIPAIVQFLKTPEGRYDQDRPSANQRSKSAPHVSRIHLQRVWPKSKY